MTRNVSLQSLLPLTVLLSGWQPVLAVPVPNEITLKGLSHADLMALYEKTGLALRDTIYVPTDQPISMPYLRPNPHREKLNRFGEVRSEIERRGRAIVPDLIKFLEREVANRRQPKQKNGIRPGFCKDTMALLVRMRATGAADVLVRILVGFEGQASIHQRRHALEALEELTYCSFSRPHGGNYAKSVEHPRSIPYDAIRADSGKAAKLYQRWLKGDGKDSDQWLAMARRRALQILAANDLPGIYCAASFLKTHGNEPARTAARLGEILSKARRQPNGDYVYQGEKVPVTIYNWALLLADHGPRARPHAKALIRLQDEIGPEHWNGFSYLRRVGGKEIMKYSVEALPRITRRLKELGYKDDPKQRFASGDSRLRLLGCRRDCHYGISRWAGRAFADDDERLQWWQASQAKSPEQWLRDGLEISARRGDQNDAMSQYLFRQVLPDLPLSRQELQVKNVMRAVPGQPYRVLWLKEHGQDLKYDEALGVFRLTMPE